MGGEDDQSGPHVLATLAEAKNVKRAGETLSTALTAAPLRSAAGLLF